MEQKNIRERTYVCIVCPNGCDIKVHYSSDAEGHPVILDVSGNRCPKGKTYVEGELTHPERTIATSVLVTGGTMPLASVRLTSPIPKERIFDAMKVLRGITVPAPVHTGDVIVSHILGYDSDVIATRDVPVRAL